MNKLLGYEQGRLAVVVSFSGEGGVEHMVVNLLKGFVHLGVGQVDLLRVRAQGPFAPMVPPGVQVLDLPGEHALSNVWPLASYLRQKRPQAVLAVKERTGRAVLLARKLVGYQGRVVLRLGTHLSASLEDRSFLIKVMRKFPLRLFYPLADAIIAVSQGVAKDVEQLVPWCRERIKVVANPVIAPEMPLQASLDVDLEWLQCKDLPVIMGAGRLTRQKDFVTLLRAFALLKEHKLARLIIFGEGRQRAVLQREIQDLSLEGLVLLPGFTENLYKYLARADLFVLCSRWEGSPNVLTEALALGVPVVATDCPSGPREILQGGRLGPLVPVGDVQALARAMEQTLAHPLDRSCLQQGVAAYDYRQSARQYLKLLFPGSAGLTGNNSL